MTSASGGNIGRMYDGSFEPDALKNTKTKAAQTSAKRCHEKPSALAAPSRQVAARRRTARTVSHGRMPTMSRTGTKYYHAPARSCSVVRKRSKCSWMKKNWRNSSFARATATNHGAVSAR